MINKLYIKYSLKLISILILTVFLGNQTYAQCKIEEGPPDIMKEYFENVRKVIINITTEATSKYIPPTDTWFSRDVKRTTNDLIWLWNDVSNWGFYGSTFEFYIVYPISSEMPNEVMRDNELIEREIENLSDYTKEIISKWYWNIEIENACEWITYCKLEWLTKEILWELIKSTSDLWELYRLSIIDEKFTFSWDIILVDKNFREEFSNYYNQNTTTECSQLEWWFFYRIKKSFNSIITSFESWKYGMEEWEEAIALLNENKDFQWNKTDEMRLLKRELSRQWVSLENSAAIMKNLEEYHDSWWYSWENNFITNSYKSVERAWKEIFNVGKKHFIEFSNVYNNWAAIWKEVTDGITQWLVKEVSVRENQNIYNRIQTTSDIWKEIIELFNAEKSFALIEDTINTSVRWRILNIHFQISQAISTLTATCPVAQKVCNKQVSWKWKCSCK